MGKFRILVWLLLLCSALQAQPGMLGTQTVNGSYTSYPLNDLGIFRQARVQATSSAASGIRNWEYYEAPSDYDPAWRSYTAGLTLTGYNQAIKPFTGTASALYNLGFGGSAGLMPAVTSNNYYTFNVTERSTPGTPLDEWMGVLETAYNPVAITSVTQSPGAGAVYPENSVYVSVTLAAAPSADEYVFVRYSTTFNFATSTLLPVTITGTTGTVEIPCQAASTTIYYYAYTSNKTYAEIMAEVATPGIGEYAHDMSTLCINNNGGPNFIYTVLPSIGFCGNYYVPSACYPTINSFVTALNAGTVGCSVVCYVAAGHTETAPAGGITLTQTGTATSTITFVKNGAGANPIIYAPVGTVSVTAASTVLDGVFSLNGSDYITIDGIDIKDNNTTGATMMEYGYALFKSSATDGCKNNVIRNCNITLNNANYWTGTPTNLEFGSTGIVMRNSTRTAITTLLTISSAAGRSDDNAFYGNTITNVVDGVVIAGFNDGTSPYSYHDQNNQVGITGSGNSIKNYGNISSTVRSSAVYSIYNNNLTISDNDISNYQSGGTAHNNTLYGVFVSSPITGNYNQVITIQNNTISLKGNTGSSRVTAIKAGNASCGASILNIDGNTIEDCTFNTPSTGEFYAMDIGFNATDLSIANNIIQNNILNTTTTAVQYLIYNNTSGSNIEIFNNQLLNNYKTVTSTSGVYYGYYSASGSATGAQSFHDNVIDGFGIPVGQNGSACAVRISTPTNQDKQVYNNTVSNVTMGTSVTTMYNNAFYIDGMNVGDEVYNNTVTNLSGGGYLAAFNFSSASNLSATSNISYVVHNNTVDGISTTSTNTGPMGFIGYMPTSGAGAMTFYNNVVKNLSTTASFSGYVYGFYFGGGTTGALLTFYNNTIQDLQHTGTTSFSHTSAGFLISCAAATLTLYGNSISGVSNLATNGAAYGFYLNATGTINIYNNYIQRIKASASGNGLAVRGIYTSGVGGTWNIRYNTIALGYDTPLSSTGSNFGFTGIDFLISSVTVKINNNIIYSVGTSNGTGLGSCLRASTPGTANTPPAVFSGSNNNYYYINNSTWNYIYTEGGSNGSNVNGYAYGGAFTDITRNLNNDECFNVIGAGTGLYKAFMSPSESNSYFDIPPFVGGTSYPYNLKLVTGSTNYAESNASVVPGIIIDYEGDARSGSTPDIGADEGDFVVQTPDCYLLPITLLNFNGHIDGAFNVLTWTTSTEHNTDYFELQRSVNATSFETIGTVAAARESATLLNYTFTDDHPVQGINYYRLKTVDLDDTYTFSHVIALQRNGDANNLCTIYPNPAGNTATISFNASSEGQYEISLLNGIGQLVMHKIISCESGEQQLFIQLAALPDAAYYVQIRNVETSSLISGSFIKH